MSGLPAQYLGYTADQKRELLRRLRREENARLSQRTGPVSYGQRALWFLHQLDPGSDAYHIQYAGRIPGPLDIPALRRSFARVLARHPSLRTRFSMRDGLLEQTVEPGETIDFEVMDVPSDEWETLTTVTSARATFSLTDGVLCKLRVLRCRPDQHLVHLVVHHIAADFWSLELMLRDLREIYTAEVEGRSASLAQTSTGYADFVAWQQNVLRGQDGNRLQDFWLKRLSGEPTELPLQIDLIRPAVQTFHGTTLMFELGQDLMGALDSLARAEDATLYTVCLAAFEVLIHRHCGQDRFLLGSPSFGRTRPEFREVVGYFVNPIVLRANLSGNPTFKECLRLQRDEVLGALDHQEYPFGLLVEALQPPRNPARSPVFQVLFALQTVFDSFTSGTAKAQGLRESSRLPLEPIALPQQAGQFELALHLFRSGKGLSGWLQYNTDLFREETARQLAQRYVRLLESIVANPGARISELTMLGRVEHLELLSSGRGRRVVIPGPQTISQRFEQQVAAAPNCEALVLASGRMTFQDLNIRANRLAWQLIELGVGPGSTVGIRMDRSLELLTSLLAVLKAGAAYVPIDPAQPAARVGLILKDAAVRCLLTQSHLTEALLAGVAPTIVVDAAVTPTSGVSRDEQPEQRAGAEDIAYLIYTSGSTGQPKGVPVSHRAALNYLNWCLEAYFTPPGSGAPVHSPIGFDLTVTTLFAPLLAGLRVYMLPPELGLERVIELMHPTETLSFIKLTPAHLRLLDRQGAAPLLARRTHLLIVGGEALLGADVAAWRRASPQLRIVNEYGPTEAAVGCATYEIAPGEEPSAAVPIGRPIPNVELHVLGPDQQLLMAGTPGELWIGGLCLASGYRNLPPLTADRFVVNRLPEPLSPLLYRSGDLVRRRQDGNLEFLGRLDDQVKLRGYRIELSEVEASLRRHELVREAAVVLGKDRGGDDALAAYLVPAGPVPPTPSDLRAHLRATLPDYMVPASFTFLDELPLNSNGKVDRRRLPTPNLQIPSSPQGYMPPTTPTEESLGRVWAEVLKLERVGIHDNFFDLGGASIHAIELVSRLAQAGHEVRPEQLLEHQTVSQLAAFLDASRTPTPNLVAPAAAPTGNTVIESLGIYLPARVLTSDEVLAGCRRPLAFPLERLAGIRSRRIAGDGEFSIDLARQAVARCFEHSKLDPADVDLVLCCNISRLDGPEHRFSCEPCTALKLRTEFGCSNALAFDITNACAGTFTAIRIVDTCLRAGLIRNAMVVSGEYISHLTRTAQLEIDGVGDPRLACLTLGDAGMAMILERGPDNEVGFQALELFTLGRYSDLCTAKVTRERHGGAIMLTDAMRQTAIAIRPAVEHAVELLERHSWPADEVRHLIMHQTSSTSLRDAMREINQVYGRQIARDDNVRTCLMECGNTATTSHFVVLGDAIARGQVQAGDRAVFSITGSGQTIGTALYRFDDLPNRLRNGSHAPTADGANNKPTRRQPQPAPSPGVFSGVEIEGIGLEAGPDGTPADAVELARLAGEKCLATCGHPRENVDLLMHVGVYRNDFLSEPALAAILAGALQLNPELSKNGKRRTFAFDVLNGSLGFLNACYLAVASIQTGHFLNPLITASEIENNRSRAQAPCLGVAEVGSAVLLRKGARPDCGFGAFRFETFPEYQDRFESHTGFDRDGASLVFHSDPDLEALHAICLSQVAGSLLRQEGLAPEQLRYVVPPQRSRTFVARVGELLGIPPDRLVNLAPTNDLHSSSLPFALQSIRQGGSIGPGDLVLLGGIGAGIQVGCALYRF